MLRIVYMGTPAYAVPPLEALVEAGYEVVCVVTQPDRPAGRGRGLRPPPVKEAALGLGLEVWQPGRLRRPEAVERLRALAPDVIVVAAYGEILRPAVLAIPPLGCLNLHASLLPRWRGASPVHAALLAGDGETGVTLMLMDEGMDTGPILAQVREPIRPDDTRGSLTARLAHRAAELLVRELPRWARGEIEPRPQDEARATYTRPLRKADGRIDWARPAVYLERQVRACDPWPGAFTTWKGEVLKVWRTRVGDGRPTAPPGTVLGVEGEALAVATGEGILLLEEVQRAGRRRVSGAAFARGQRDLRGARLGEGTTVSGGGTGGL